MRGLVLVFGGCAQVIHLKDAGVDSGGRPDTADADTDADTDLGDACLGETRTETQPLEFPARDVGCDWSEDDNIEPMDGVITARAVDTVTLDLDPGAVICDLAFDFHGGDQQEQIIRYDDDFLLMFGDAVLAASYGPMVDLLAEDGILRLYDWEDLVGTTLSFDDADPYCLGEAEALSSCEVPPPETAGPIELSFGDPVVDALAARAWDREDYSFRFVTVGDNDPLDCSHAGLVFSVEVTYTTP